MTEKMRINEDGNVGIGTSDPYSTLHLMSENDTNLLFIHNTKGGLDNNAGILFSTFPVGGANARIAAIDEYSNNGALAFYTDNDNVLNYNVQERMRITKDGNVGIGIINPSSKLDVNGDVHVAGDLTVDGAIEVAENIEIQSGISTNLSASGIKTNSIVDINNFGYSAALFLAADGNYEEADADAVTTMPCVALALETGTGIKDILLQGYIRNDSWAWSTIGGPVYVSPTTGSLTQTIPTATGQQVQIVGYATTSNIIYFSPNLMLIELK